MNLNNRLYLFAVYTIIVFYVPYHIIQTYQTVLEDGESFNFKIEYRDPYDPFRGNYLNLRYEIEDISNIKINNTDQFKYVLIDEDTSGYAFVSKILKDEPENVTEFLKLYIKPNVSGSDNYHIQFGFNKYFIQESKALLAEQIYNEAVQDSTKSVYAVIQIKDGFGVIDKIMIDDVDLIQLLNQH